MNGKKALFFLLLILFAFLNGCSHKVASFFFDGVPMQTDTALQVARKDSVIHLNTTVSIATLESSPELLVYSHPPYKNKKCKLCHDPSSPVKLISQEPMLCYNCHDDFNTSYKVLHGPVGGGQCSACHSPHQSENAKLLLRTGQELCLFCHDSKDVLRNEKHKLIGSRDCQDCHNPHGGDTKFLLK